MDKLKIIFLDFDGVISTHEKGIKLDTEKVALLEEILSATGAKIVVTSSWRVGTRNKDEFVNKLFNFHRSKDYISKCPLFVNSIYDVTDTMGNDRGEEIQRWIDKHENEIDQYIILDDENEYSDEQLFNFVQTDEYEGLTIREAKLCIKMLNGERIEFPSRINRELTFRRMLRYKDMENFHNNIDSLTTEYFMRFRK